MSELYDAATVDQTDDGKFYIYKGGITNEDDEETIEHVRVDESVTIIDHEAFAYCGDLQTIEFPAKNQNKDVLLKEIGEESFYQCSRLSSMKLQDTGVETIGDRAFALCMQLATVQLPSSIRQIGRECFGSCDKLKVLDLSHVTKLETLEEYTFSGCRRLTTVNFPSTMSHIGRDSFLNCPSLEMVDLSTTCVNEIEDKAFSSCKNLTAVYFPTTMKRMGQYNFYRCEKLSSVDLHATSIETIEDSVFNNCIALETINFPVTLKYIRRFSFANCTKLEYLNLEETSIEKIGFGAFHNCTNLATVTGISTTAHHDEEGRVQEGTMDDGSIKLPASLVEVGKISFDRCPKLNTRIDSNRMHYECDVNRGGRRFLQRHDDNNGVTNENIVTNSNDDGANKPRGKVYFSSLWPLILRRVFHDMELPRHEICSENGENLLLYTNANPLQRRASVVLYLLVHGVVADLQPSSRSENAQAKESV